MTSTSHRYRPDIDGLRTLAIIPVVLYHAGFDFFSGGFVGVDIFFVISGFLITGIIWREITEDRFSLVAFYERRARRILPPLFAVIAVTLFVGWFLLTADPFTSLANSAFAGIVSLSNVFFWRQSGYFSTAADLYPLLHTWSLGVEEQFYIVVPFILLAAVRFGRQVVIAVLLLIVVSSLAVCIWASYRYPSANFYLLPTRAWELGIGGLLAITAPRVPRSIMFRHGIGAVGASMILVTVFFFDKDTIFPGISTLLPCVGTALLIWIGSDSNNVQKFSKTGGAVNWLLATRPMVAIGLISYSLYLWHWPVFVYLRHLTGQIELSWHWGVIGSALSLLLAIISWRFIEKPFRNRALIGSRAIALYSVTSAITLATVALTISFVLKGVPSRVPETARQFAAFSKDFDRSCMNTLPSTENLSAPGCRIGSESLEPSFILMGDSHAAALRPAISVWAEETRRSGYFQAFNSCPPVGGAIFGVHKGKAYARCGQHASETLEFALSSTDIRTIILTAYWEAYLERNDALMPTKTEGLSVHPATDQSHNASQRIFLEAMSDIISQARLIGKEVIIVHDLPEPPTDIPWSSATATMIGRAATTHFMLDNEQGFYDQLDAVAKRLGARTVRLSELLCDPETNICRALHDEFSLFKDNNHLSKTGATEVVGPWLTKQLSKQ